MDNGTLKKKTVSGMLWRFAENGFSQIVNFVISIILARLLLPEDYGIIALVSVFITICDKLVVSGFATSLIQKKDADDKDFSTVFFFSLAMSLALYAVLFFGAPLIANFYNAYNKELLVSVIRVMGLQTIAVAISSVQNAYVSRAMQFKKFFFSTLGGTLLSAVVGIWLAYAGYGVWALVAQYLVKAFGSMFVIWFTVRWRPKFVFSFERFKSLYSYGWKIFAASVIKVLYNDLRSLLIGKFYNAEALAFYNKGQSFPQIVETSVGGAIDSVFFPAISKKQSSEKEMLSMLRRGVKISTYVLTPLLFGLAAVARPLILVLLTEKWLESVFFLQIISFSFVLSPVELQNLQAIKAIGRSDLVLKLEIIKKTLGVVLLVIAVPIGVEAIAVSLLLSNVAASVINAFPNRRLIGYTYRMQIADIFSPLWMSAVMYAAVFAVSFINLPAIAMLVLQILTGMAVYLLLSVITKNPNFKYILQILKDFKNKH